ncbi:hypothetical protein SESBI_47076 [Sesbania bispinosa]|nr:hypothetical protein SESBI_47076 [Sesbania bispinosa]
MLLAHEARIEIQGQNLIRDLIMKMQTYLLHEAHRQPDPQSTTHPLYINEV